MVVGMLEGWHEVGRREEVGLWERPVGSLIESCVLGPQEALHPQPSNHRHTSPQHTNIPFKHELKSAKKIIIVWPAAAANEVVGYYTTASRPHLSCGTLIRMKK